MKLTATSSPAIIKYRPINQLKKKRPGYKQNLYSVLELQTLVNPFLLNKTIILCWWQLECIKCIPYKRVRPWQKKMFWINKLHRVVKLQSLSSEKCRVPFHCHYSQFHSAWCGRTSKGQIDMFGYYLYLYLPTPPLGRNMTQGQFLSGV